MAGPLCGLPRSHLAHVFRPFLRSAESAVTRSSKRPSRFLRALGM